MVWALQSCLVFLQGDLVGAEDWFMKARMIDPKDGSVYQHYGQNIFLTDTSLIITAANTWLFSKSVKQIRSSYTVFPRFSAGSHLSAWSRMSAGSKVIVFQMSAQKNEPIKCAGFK